MLFRNGLGCCGVSEDYTNLITEFAVAYWIGMLLSIGLECCGVQEADINLITEIGMLCC